MNIPEKDYCRNMVFYELLGPGACYSMGKSVLKGL